MPSSLNSLTRHDRGQLQALKKGGFSQRGVAAEIDCPQCAATEPPVSEAVRNPAPGGLAGSPRGVAHAPRTIKEFLMSGTDFGPLSGNSWRRPRRPQKILSPSGGKGRRLRLLIKPGQRLDRVGDAFVGNLLRLISKKRLPPDPGDAFHSCMGLELS